ncbi:hypothetical protein RIF29_41112 [Crotalaria pallida]|uniref:3'-5' exonuclease domain-containing protein n=1 Tax=Crotalaria pallida TaxID=3830 RepID=A0AAN9E9W2_CROPI
MTITINRSHYYTTHSIFTVNLHGTEITVTVTATPSVVRQWVHATLYNRRLYRFLNRFVVGLGVQWTPDGSSNPPAEILQLCVGCKCLVFQLELADRVPLKLRKFLLDPTITFVGLWNHSDRKKLRDSVHRLEMCKNPIDLRYHAETEDDENLVRASLSEIVEKSLGYEVDQSREVSMSDWGKEVLSSEQVLYACIDAHCAFLIGKNRRAWEL